MLGTAFAKIAEGKPVLLPRMRPLGDMDEDEMAFEETSLSNEPPAIDPIRRHMLLTQQVKRRSPDQSWDQAVLGAEALARFLDQVQIEQGDLNDLPRLVEDQDLAAHWQQTLVFLEIVTKNWPLILAGENCQDPAPRRNALMKTQADLWRKNPPPFPIIAAGSTGSIPATADFLKVLAELPEGLVILPGLDRVLDDDSWEKISETHPQHSMKQLLEKIGVERKSVPEFSALTAPRTPPSRLTLLSEAMRPAERTETWRDLRGKLGASAIEGITQLTLAHPQEEAQVIALKLREVLETPPKTAAFVTADRALGVRVATLMRRWGIDINDSGGSPLKNLPVGSFLSLVLQASAPNVQTVSCLSLLKHPLAACGLAPSVCRAKSRAAEMRLRSGEEDSLDFLKACLKPLTEIWHQQRPLADWITEHIAASETVATTNAEKGSDRLWKGEDGEAAASWFDAWREASKGFPALSGEDYTALFSSMAASKTVRVATQSPPRLSILGPLEARLFDADLIILGGMNEGSWPPDTGFDPWMSRPMRRKMGLSAPEYRIGLSAHDFAQLACAKEVMLTRSLRANGTPTVPSRFLLQLDAVLQASGLGDKKDDALAPANPWREWAHRLDTPTEIAPCAPPCPRPPLAFRPKSLSVTEISTWLRNPYAIYAKHVLKLKKLDELDADLDAADRGTMIHKILEIFVRTYPKTLPPDPFEALSLLGREVFSGDKGDPRVRAFWETAFKNIAVWFAREELSRRSDGIGSVKAEIQGTCKLGDFTLTGRADRIELLGGGGLRIIDYKTGSVPSQTDVVSGIEPQLQLLALIARNGGFDNLPPTTPHACEYWKLKGGTTGCAATIFEEENKDKNKDLPVLISRAEAGLKRLIAAFSDPSTPYEPTPRARVQPRFDDYAHLARQAEWGKTGETK